MESSPVLWIECATLCKRIQNSQCIAAVEIESTQKVVAFLQKFKVASFLQYASQLLVTCKVEIYHKGRHRCFSPSQSVHPRQMRRNTRCHPLRTAWKCRQIPMLSWHQKTKFQSAMSSDQNSKLLTPFSTHGKPYGNLASKGPQTDSDSESFHQTVTKITNTDPPVIDHDLANHSWYQQNLNVIGLKNNRLPL